jgi:hypothetical protein
MSANKNGMPWTAKEEEYLKSNAGRIPFFEIAETLGRTENAARAKIFDMERRAAGGEPKRPRPKCQRADVPPGGTLCWKCRRSGNLKPVKECRWVRDGKSVEGWEAIKTQTGHCVLRCPEFLEN